VAEKGSKDEIELAVVADFINTSVAEANRLTFPDRGQRDLGGERECDADAGTSHTLAEAGVGLNPDYNAVFDKGELGVLCVNEAGGLGVAFQVIPAFGAAEKLLFQGALQGIAADLELDGAGLPKNARRQQGNSRPSFARMLSY